MGFAVHKDGEEQFFDAPDGVVTLETSAHATVHQLDNGVSRILLDYSVHGGHTDVYLTPGTAAPSADATEAGEEG